jgi:hypothetical protein
MLADGLLPSLAFFGCFFEGYLALYTCIDLEDHCQVRRVTAYIIRQISMCRM